MSISCRVGVRLRSAMSGCRCFRAQQRCFSEWGQRGYDITSDLLSFGDRPKTVLQAYAPTGFDVLNLVKRVDPNEQAESGTLHMHGSIIAFPFGSFLWNITGPKDVTLESLAPIMLHRPKIEYLFIGCNESIDRKEIDRIQAAMPGLVVEKMMISNAMGTFNILNAEDRQVCAALVLDPND
ncbi:hypothetical protein MPSEU_000885100 [Mayamaea pseudoterrestris]|nr:hypothetical protein MPSEU_000885100 [Mayamaea pseudoterrestris]